jgi:hypothetical protein
MRDFCVDREKNLQALTLCDKLFSCVGGLCMTYKMGFGLDDSMY